MHLFIFSNLSTLNIFENELFPVCVIHLTCLTACNSFVEQGGIKHAVVVSF